MVSHVAQSSPYDVKATDLALKKIDEMKAEIDLASFMEKTNSEQEKYTAEKIAALNAEWMAEKGENRRKITGNQMSHLLKKMVNGSGGAFDEILLIGKKALTLAQSKDKMLIYKRFSQNDPKWLAALKKEPGSVYVSEMIFDEKSQTFNIEVAVKIEEGLMIFSVNVENL